jgi:hypothetical protein
VPASAGAAEAALRDLKEEADAHCQHGEPLLTLTNPQDVTAFRRWRLDECERWWAAAVAAIASWFGSRAAAGSW